MKTFHWSKVDYFPYFLESVKSAALALEYLVDDLHVSKEQTIKKFLQHCGSEDFLWGIVRLMSSDSLRISGNSAYVFGTIAETSDGIERVLGLLTNQSHPESARILPHLIHLLKTSDFECMMNAAGTIGTISENNVGRTWLLSQPHLEEIIELNTSLLENNNIWVSSNAALVIARISIEDQGCEKLLSHKSSKRILLNLVNSLGCDNSGKGMNCAFAIGRICDNENGRSNILKIIEPEKLINSLSTMIKSNVDNGCTKNACYALSCLAANQQAHKLVVENPNFADLLTVLCRHLTTIRDPETQWFAAMLMRVLSMFPNGCLKMKKISIIWNTLNDLLKREDLLDDVKEEVNFVLDTLKPLPKPNPVRITVKGSTEIYCEWDLVNLKSKLSLKYILYKDDECVYRGDGCSFLVENLSPFREYSFSHCLETPDNGERSQPSDHVRGQTLESTPEAPNNLKLLMATTTQIKIGWEPPASPNGVLGAYNVYCGDLLVEQTNELQSLIAGLQPATSVDISVCATTSCGAGERAVIRVQTCSLGELTPDRPVFGLIGTREILVRWQPPQVLTGKLNRYELIMNGKCVYSGVALEHQVTMLKPDTEYKFEVVAITSEGKCRSKGTKVRTLKDEYDPERLPLYPGTNNNQNNINNLVKEKIEPNFEGKKNKENNKSTSNRQKTKIKISKDVFQATGSDILPSTSASRRNSNHVLNSSSILPPVDELKSVVREKTSLENKRGRFSIATNRSSPKPTFSRSKTLTTFNHSTHRQSQAQTFVHPTTFTLDLKEVTPKFPSIPVNNGNNHDISYLSSSNYHGSFSLTTTPTMGSQAIKNLQRKKEFLATSKSTEFKHNKNQTTSIDANLKPELSIQYRYLLNKLNREKTVHHVADRIEPLSINRTNSFTLTKFSK